MKGILWSQIGKMYLKISGSLHRPGETSNSGPEFSNCQRILTTKLLICAQESASFRASVVNIF